MVSDLNYEKESLGCIGLNPCFNGRWSRTIECDRLPGLLPVLILVLMEDGLGLSQACIFLTRLVLILVLMEDGLGQCGNCHIDGDRGVLILVLMEDGLGPMDDVKGKKVVIVLILVLMEDGLGHLLEVPGLGLRS